jgi:hypothetical protein
VEFFACSKTCGALSAHGSAGFQSHLAGLDLHIGREEVVAGVAGSSWVELGSLSGQSHSNNTSKQNREFTHFGKKRDRNNKSVIRRRSGFYNSTLAPKLQK